MAKTHTSIFFSHRGVKLTQGRMTGSKLRVELCYTAALPPELRGASPYGQEPLLAYFLSSLWTQLDLPRERVTLVLDTDMALTKTMLAPPVKPRQVRQLVRNELAGAVLPDTDYLYDYTPTHPGGAGGEILAAAAEKSLIYAYAAGFAQAGISLEAIDLALPCAIRLLSQDAVLRRLSYICLIADESNVSTLLFLDGGYHFFNSTTLFAPRGGQEASLEMARAVSNMMQFNTAQRTEREIETAYFCGVSERELSYGEDVSGYLSLPVAVLPRLSMLEYAGRQEPAYWFSDYIYPLGALLSR